MSSYLSAKQVKEKYQITSQTLYNWRKGDKIKFSILPSGKIVYFPIEESTQPKFSVFYARVSNTKQKDGLEHQKQILRSYMASNGIKIDGEYFDIASGMNESRKDFTRLMQDCIDGKVEQIFITYKDRLTRFGYGYVEDILSKLGVKIEVLNATTEEDFQQELTQDLVSIIHHFSMKMYSNRRKMLKELESEIVKDISTQ